MECSFQNPGVPSGTHARSSENAEPVRKPTGHSSPYISDDTSKPGCLYIAFYTTLDDDPLPAFLMTCGHTRATHLLQEGLPVTTVFHCPGHANPAITLAVYAHAVTDMYGDAMRTPPAFAFTGTD
jgi:hypothetical protein